jgi:iron complex outermembrane receptor protein
MLKGMTFRSALAAVACAISLSAHAMADSPKNIEIPAGNLRPALLQLSKTFGVELFYQPSQLDHVHTAGVKGNYTPEAAVRLLLKGTPLDLRTDPSGAMMVIDPKAPRATAVSALSEQAALSAGNGDNSQSRSGLQLAQATQGQTSGATSSVERQGESSSNQKPGLEEVLVTAQKREERLQDVPVPVTAISADVLAQNAQVRLQDYFSLVPGFVVSPAGNIGNPQNLAIRGINSGQSTNSTVGITVDDVPFGSTTSFSSDVPPDLDPSDLSRVEVLRGPQGTLYGANSMGGLLKFVTVDPSTEALSGRVQADVDSVYNGQTPGYGFRGVVNVPLSDTLAIRASGFTRQDPGYVDNPVFDIKGINEDRAGGGRLSTLWRPSDVVSLKLSALYQDLKGDGISDVDVEPGLADLQQNYYRGCCAFDKKLQAYSAIATVKLGSADITSVTGYNVNQFSSTLDYSFLLGPLFAKPLFGAKSVADYWHGQTDRFTQELRASIPITSKVDWLIGGFYSYEDTSLSGYLPAVNTDVGQAVGTVATASLPSKFTEYAGFTDLTVHFTDRFDVQFGGRESFIDQDFETVNVGGPLFGGSAVYPAIKYTPNAFTYLVTPRLKFSPDLMLYARVASGFRPGVSNSFNTDPLVPRAAAPDKTQNYEIGLKGNVLDHALSFDASLYYINWKSIQIALLDPRNELSYTANGSEAKSEGVELSVEATPLSGLTISAWATYDDAVLTEALPARSTVYAPDGTRLPYGTRFSGNFSANQTFRLVGEAAGFAGVQLSYLGNRLGTFVPFRPTAPRAYYPAYAKLDLRTGVEYHQWTVSLYVNNVCDRRGVLGGGVGTFPPFAYYYIQPRTIGLSLTRTF